MCEVLPLYDSNLRAPMDGGLDPRRRVRDDLPAAAVRHPSAETKQGGELS